jgi:hypothetical protein
MAAWQPPRLGLDKGTSNVSSQTRPEPLPQAYS